MQQSLQSHLDQTSSEAHQWLQKLMTRPDLMTQLTSALVILIVTLFLSRWVSDAAKKLARRFVQNDADRTLPEFLSQVVRWMILTLGFVAIMNRLGIETASFITVLGAASLSIGLALQGALGNVAAGLMLLFTKPYRIGDNVRLGEVTGRVHRLGLFSTEIDSVENIRVYVPNSKVFANEINNLTTNGAVRIEVLVEIAADDLDAAVAVMKRVADSQPMRLQTHETFAGLREFSANGVQARIDIWVLPADGPKARNDLIIALRGALGRAGVDIPYPHQVAITKGPEAN